MLRAERLASAAPAAAPQVAAATPLSHHEILALIGPFTHSGRSVDMAASDRLARRLAFKPRSLASFGSGARAVDDHVVDSVDSLQGVQGPGGPGGGPGLVEQLVLEDIGRAGHALTRTLTRPDGAQATLLAEGPDIATLLHWVDAVPPAVHWLAGPGWDLVLHHRLNPPLPRGGRGAAPATAPDRVLTKAAGRVGGLQLQATVSRVKNVPVDIVLQSAARGGPSVLPEDLLAVLGLPWSRLVRLGGSWRASVRVKGTGPERSAHAVQALQQAMQHLAQTLGEAPGRFHARFAAARWRVSLRRGFPLLVCSGLIGASAAVPWMGITRDSVYQMLVFNAPPILMVWLFSMRELPRIEIPPLPRPLPDTAWVPASVQHDHGVAG